MPLARFASLLKGQIGSITAWVGRYSNKLGAILVGNGAAHDPDIDVARNIRGRTGRLAGGASSLCGLGILELPHQPRQP